MKIKYSKEADIVLIELRDGICLYQCSAFTRYGL